MSRSLDGYLILGWEVEDDVSSDDEWDEKDSRAEEKLEPIATELGLKPYQIGPAWWWSAFCECDCMWVGVRLGTADYWGSSGSIQEFSRWLSENADRYEKVAYEVYEEIMGSPADTPPEVLEIGCEG